MTKHILKNVGLMVFGLVFVFNGVSVRAQTGPSTPEAKAAFEQGEAAQKKHDYTNAVSFYRKAIELDPNYAEAHEQFRIAFRQAAYAGVKSDLPEDERSRQLELVFDKAREDLIAVYEGWAQKDPKNPLYQGALGDLYQTTDYEKAEQHLLKAVSLNPKYAEAYQTLAMVYEVSGNEKKRMESLRKAAEAAPQDASYAFYYAASLRRGSNSDFAVYPKKAIEVAERFPNDDRGAQSLYWLAFETNDPKEKLAVYERLRSSFPPEKFSWSEAGMGSLFEVYTKTNPQKALALAEEMTRILKDEDDKKRWQDRVEFQKNVLQAKTLTGEKKYSDAIALLEKTKLPKYMHSDVLNLVKAETLDSAGQTDKAYQEILGVISSEPTDDLQKALTGYGAELNKTRLQVDADVRNSLNAKAKPVKDFSFARYGDGKQVSLSDYRGKVVLLNFWYPFCGPCRGENPNLQKVLEKYKDKFVILAVNVHPDEGKYVLPYTNGNRFGFVPLKSNMEFAEKEFQARGMPSNFLIDPEGRIVYKPGVTQGQDEVRKLELQIESLLPQSN